VLVAKVPLGRIRGVGSSSHSPNLTNKDRGRRSTNLAFSPSCFVLFVHRGIIPAAKKKISPTESSEYTITDCPIELPTAITVGNGTLTFENGGSFNTETTNLVLGSGGASSAAIFNDGGAYVQFISETPNCTMSLSNGAVVSSIIVLEVNAPTTVNDSMLTSQGTGGVENFPDYASVASTLTLLNGGQYVLPGNITNVSGTVNASGTGTSFASGGINVTGGSVSISGGASMTQTGIEFGSTIGSGGTVSISGTGSTGSVYALEVQSQGSLQVANDATLTVKNGNFLNPVLTIDSGANVSVLSGGTVDAYQLSMTGGTLTMGLSGDTSGLDGQIDVTNAADFAGTLDVALQNGFIPAVGDQFDLFTFGSESGEFSNMNLPTLPNGTWDTSDLYTTGTISVVPEPASIGVLVAGASMLMVRRRPGFKSPT